MQHLTILVPEGEGNNLSRIIGAYKIFTKANEYRMQKGRNNCFQFNWQVFRKK